MGAAGIARTPAATRRWVLTLTSAASLMVVLDALMVTHRAERDPGAPGCFAGQQRRAVWPGRG